MAMHAVIEFWQAVRSDPALQKRLEPAGGGPKLQAADSAAAFERQSRIAREAGFDCSAEELRAAEAVTRFWIRVLEDQSLQKDLIAAEELEHDQAVELVHSVANKAGFKCTVDQLDAITKAQVQTAGPGKSEGELNDSQLDAVAGGAGMGAVTFFSADFAKAPQLNKVLAYYDRF